MSRRRNIVAVGAALAVVALYAGVTQYLHLLTWREAYRLGELAGITRTPAQGGSLGGQILGFNYSRPSSWYEQFAQAVAATIWLAPSVLLALYAKRCLAHTSPIWSPRSIRVARWMAVAVTAGVAFILLERLLHQQLWQWLLELGEALGGTVYRLGAMGTTQRGVFNGPSWVDYVFNGLLDHAPRVMMAVISACAAMVADALWQRATARRVRGLRLCGQCGYDLRATTNAKCPECGAYKAEC